MNLSEAQLCLDCEELYDVARIECPRCASKSAIPLHKMVEPVKTEERRTIVFGADQALRAMVPEKATFVRAEAMLFKPELER